MTLINGTAPRRYKGTEKRAYEIGASRGYDHANEALTHGRNPDGVGEIPRGLRGNWEAWSSGWEAGASDAKDYHDSP